MENSLIAVLLIAPLTLFALGEQPEVVAGHAIFERPNAQTEVVKVADKTIIEYQRFNLAQDERTEFVQPSSRSTLLCRIKGRDPSVLRGCLEANGRLLFINPNGIFFSETAQVSVGTLIASTLDIRNHDFLNDRFQFKKGSDSSSGWIVNQGRIETAQGAVFLASETSNQGVVYAKTGKIIQLGGECITLDFDGDGQISFAIEAPLKEGFIEQAGDLLAEEVFLKLQVAEQLIKSVVNMNGIAQATRIEIDNGVIRLAAGSATKTEKLHVEGGAIELEEGAAISGMCNFKAREGIQLKGSQTFKQVSLIAKEIDQQGPVASKGPVYYRADQIRVGDTITTTQATITFEGPVVLTGKREIQFKTGFTKGDVIFHSTLDAHEPTQTLKIHNGKGLTAFKGDVGTKGPLGALTIDSGQVVFYQNIGGVSPGVVNQLHVKAGSAHCQGSLYHTGEQLWNTTQISLTQAGAIEFKTVHRPLCFGQHASLLLSKTEGLKIDTQGGNLTLAPISSDQLQPIAIQAGAGEAHVKEIGTKISKLLVEGGSILIAGQLEADQIFLGATHRLEYGAPPGGDIIPTAIKSSGVVTLNSKHGAVGSFEYPLHIETSGELYVGAKTIAYLTGRCADQNPHVYSKNPPPRTFFDGYEYNYLFIEEIMAGEGELKTLAHDLFSSTSSLFINGSVIQPRRALIYYEHK